MLAALEGFLLTIYIILVVQYAYPDANMEQYATGSYSLLQHHLLANYNTVFVLCGGGFVNGVVPGISF